MAGDDPKERRRAERVPINSEFVGGASTYVSDLSERGVFLHTKEKVPIGTNIELRFTVLLDDPVTVEALGTVVRHQPEGLGVQFGPLSPTMVLRINDAVSRMRPRDLGPPLARSDAETSAPVPAKAQADVLTEQQFQEARTGVFKPVSAGDDGHEVEMIGGHAVAEPSAEAFDEEKTLFRLKPVDVEIVDDEPDALD